MGTIGKAIRIGVGVCWPTTCEVCGAIVPAIGPRWCPSCAVRLAREVGGEYCPRCGRSTGQWELSGGACGRCRGRPLGYERLVRVGAYTGVLRRMILAYKYHGQWQLGRVLARLLIECLRRADWLTDVEVFVPVPQHWSRRLMRRIHHTAELSREAAAGLSGVWAPALRAQRAYRPQVGLSAAARHRNIRGVFAVRRGVRVTGRCCCVIDDVRTSGATLAEAGRVLRGAGATKVYAAVLARAEVGSGSGGAEFS